MNRRKQRGISAPQCKRQRKQVRGKKRDCLQQCLNWFVPQAELFPQDEFHGNIRWNPVHLVVQALIWSWQETKNVTDAFAQCVEICKRLGLTKATGSYTSFMNALDRYQHILGPRLRRQFQSLAEEVGGRYYRTGRWVLIAFDGSRSTAPRTVSNERAFCAPNYGKGGRAKYGKKKSKGMRRRRNEQNKPHPQSPQAWVTMLWHMGLRLPWTWRLGPSHSSERDHVKEILATEEFPENTLFCGDAGFTGYPLWNTILAIGANFLVRVGSNVNLLSEKSDIKKLGGGIVLCWPKGQQQSGHPPLRLRLVRVPIGKTKMWMLTNVQTEPKLTRKAIVRYYKMRWGVEVEFRGLKQTIDKHKLRCRNHRRLLVELDWSLRGMAVAELIALHAQISQQPKDHAPYDPKDRSLANTMRVLRKFMRNLNEPQESNDGLMIQLSQAQVQRYVHHTDKQARYRPWNPDKKRLRDPTVRRLTSPQRNMLRQHSPRMAA